MAWNIWRAESTPLKTNSSHLTWRYLEEEIPTNKESFLGSMLDFGGALQMLVDFQVQAFLHLLQNISDLSLGQ